MLIAVIVTIVGIFVVVIRKVLLLSAVDLVALVVTVVMVTGSVLSGEALVVTVCDSVIVQ